jgi:8-oxo-dGTP diphosphatase
VASEKLFQVGVKGLIENKESKILLLKAPGWEKNNTPAHWDIPGGRVQEGDTILETLKREIEEETGITQLDGTTFFTAVVSNHEIPLSDTKKAGLMLVIYKVSAPDNSTVILSEEHTEYEWVDKADAAKRLDNKYPEEFTSLLLQ